MKLPIKLHPALFGVLILLAFMVGFGMRGGHRNTHEGHTDIVATAEVTEWTCSMHPQIRQPKPGKCPLCGMDLIPVIAEDASEVLSPREIRLSPHAAKLAEVQTAIVRRGSIERDIRLVGKIDYNETSTKKITAWIPGRIDRLHVDFTGTEVRAGQPLASLYSPELVTAQQELIQARHAARELENSSLATLRESSQRTLASAREKLRLLGLTTAQIAEIENNGNTTDHITVNSPSSGIVIEKNAVEGMYVDTGMVLYSIADLSTVWAMLDVYENDLQWIRMGQPVEFTSEAYPGEVFKGKVSFIDPVLNSMTRTVKVRVDVPNLAGKLKPDMFVRSVIKASVAKTSVGDPLIIPASAPLLTGKRAVVYVESPDREHVYEGREVVLGPRAGDYYEVREGLHEGEKVVVNGAFKIDSAVQILARPSMMNPEGGVVPPSHDHGHGGHGETPQTGTHQDGVKQISLFEKSDIKEEFLLQLDNFYSGYYRVQDALSHDNLEETRKAASPLAKELEKIDGSLLDGKAGETWKTLVGRLNKESSSIAGARNLNAARSAFYDLSYMIIEIAENFGTSGKLPVFRFYCSMVDNNRGGDWLQGDRDISNPYFGASMLKCGELKRTISSGN